MLSFMKYISVTSRCAMQYRNDMLADTSLSGFQYIYIIEICRTPGISQEGLARAIHINKSNVTRQLDKLENNGYVERSFCPCDRRISEVYPTDKAYDVLPRVRECLHRWNAYLTEDFTEEEKET
ncbi:MAG: MarR family winged helix-turn-helix transcriptional regulator, partial [Eubacteriales bacterium]